MSTMKITRLVPYFGANARNAHLPAAFLEGCTFVYIPFAGSMCEIPHFPASTQIMVSDLHDELIALASVVAHPDKKRELAAWLDAKLFHPAVLEEAQHTLALARAGGDSWLFGDGGAGRPSVEECAEAYFVSAWMGRSAMAGTRGEDRSGLALRYDAGGGDPVTRYRSAVESLDAWHHALRRCAFTREDAFGVIRRLARKPHDPAKPIGVYCDPPWPDDGDRYLHVLNDMHQAMLAKELAELPHAVVMRFGDHPLIRELYPASVWTWHHVDGRDQDNKAKAEVFLVKSVTAKQ